MLVAVRDATLLIVRLTPSSNNPYLCNDNDDDDNNDDDNDDDNNNDDNDDDYDDDYDYDNTYYIVY